MNFYVYDPRIKWFEPAVTAARARGYNAGELSDKPGYCVFLPHANPDQLKVDQALARTLKHVMITDLTQIEVYDNKRKQTALWSKWMPETWVFTNKEEALSQDFDFPLISKADVGASSYNVRLIKDKGHLSEHLEKIFSRGIEVNHCDSIGTKSLQKGYVILQRFIPHDVTYRVNVIGRERAIFYRRNYKDRPMAQTGNVEPSKELTPKDVSLLDYVNEVKEDVQTNWCAFDILQDGNGWKLLETSLRWPWPSPGDCDNAVFFNGGKTWIDMWDVLIDEIEAGAFEL